MNRIYGGGEADQLPARGKLGSLLRPLVEQGRITLVKGFHTEAIVQRDGRPRAAGRHRHADRSTSLPSTRSSSARGSVPTST